MATGKSTVGKQLAEQLARPFVDLDVVVEQMASQLYGMSINEVFLHLGEAVFRRLEYEVLQDLLKDTEGESVIALGGGTLHNNDLAQKVLQDSLLFVLRADWAMLKTRIIQSSRPLKETAFSLYTERSLGYDIGRQIRVDDKSVEDIVSEICEEVLRC